MAWATSSRLARGRSLLMGVSLGGKSLPRPFPCGLQFLDALPDERQVVAVVVAERAVDDVLLLAVVGNVPGRAEHLRVLIGAREGQEELRRLGPDLVHPAVDLAPLRAELVGGREAVEIFMLDQDVR